MPVRIRFRASITLVACLPLFLWACQGQPRIEGRVLDNFKQPIEGVQVKVSGMQFSDTTESDGRYTVPFAPGKFQVLYTKDQHVSHSSSFEVLQDTVIPADDVVLTRLPGKGAFVVGPRDYLPLSPAGEIMVIDRLAGRGFDRASTYAVDVDFANQVELKQSDSGQYYIDFALPIPRAVLLGADGNSNFFKFQPLYKIEEQKSGVQLFSYKLGGYQFQSAEFEPDKFYLLAALGEEGCGFLTCMTLEKPAFLIKTLAPASAQGG